LFCELVTFVSILIASFVCYCGVASFNFRAVIVVVLGGTLDHVTDFNFITAVPLVFLVDFTDVDTLINRNVHGIACLVFIGATSWLCATSWAVLIQSAFNLITKLTIVTSWAYNTVKTRARHTIFTDSILALFDRRCTFICGLSAFRASHASGCSGQIVVSAHWAGGLVFSTLCAIVTDWAVITVRGGTVSTGIAPSTKTV